MRWLGLCVLAAFAVLFLWMSRHGRAAGVARRNIDRHLPDETEGRGSGARSWPFFGRLSRRLEKTRVSTRLREQLEESGLPIGWEVLWRAWLAGIVMLPLGAYLLTGSLLAIPAALAAALSLPGAVLRLVGRSRSARARERCDALAADLALFLRSGIPVEDALGLCASDTVPPVSGAIVDFQSQVALGASVDGAFIELASALDHRDLLLIAQAIVTSHETGADIGGIMDIIGEAVRERSAIRRELASQTVQGRLSGRVVAALPLLFLGLSALVSRGTLSILLGTTPGLIMLAVAVVLNVLGFLWIKKILDIK